MSAAARLPGTASGLAAITIGLASAAATAQQPVLSPPEVPVATEEIGTSERRAAAESSISKGEYTDCRPMTAPLVFDGGYQVSMCYETAEGTVGEARAGIWASGQSGLLWFFDRDNAEVLVKVLNGCSHNGHRWVFVAPVTDVAFNLHVTGSSGRQWTQRNRLGETAATRSDTSAFVCTEDDATITSVAAGARPGNVTGQAVAKSPIARGEHTDCRPVTTPLVFDGGFHVSLCYETVDGKVGDARGGIWASNQSGLLWFFSRGNAEVLVKVLNGCSHNGHRWVFVAPVTDVAFNLHVTSSSGRIWMHRNRLGDTAVARSDTRAFGCDAEPKPVAIPDANLRSAIEDALGLESGTQLTQAGLESLKSLEAKSANVQDLTGLEFATNLTRLILDDNEIVDLAPLAGLTRPRLLSLSFNSIADVSPLAGLNDLTSLGLRRNAIADLSPLAGLSNLVRLDVAANAVADVSPLAGLADLEVLDCRGNEIVNVSPLEGLFNLRYLALDDNRMVDVSSLASLTGLGSLYLAFNGISDVSSLDGLPNLLVLDLRGNPLDGASLDIHVPSLQRRGVEVVFDAFARGEFDIELVFLGAFSSFEKRQIEWASRRWMSVISDDLPDHVFDQRVSRTACGDDSFEIPAGERIDDLRVYVSSFRGETGDPIGFGGPTLIRNAGLPVVGCVAVDLERAYLPVLVSHELGHVLGFGPMWSPLGLLQDPDADIHFNGPLAIAAFDDAGGLNYTGTKVPLHDRAHWRYSVLRGEVMGPYGGTSLSAITVQAMADIGYGVDVAQADKYTLPGVAATASAGEASGAEIQEWPFAEASRGADGSGGGVCGRAAHPVEVAGQREAGLLRQLLAELRRGDPDQSSGSFRDVDTADLGDPVLGDEDVGVGAERRGGVLGR